MMQMKLVTNMLAALPLLLISFDISFAEYNNSKFGECLPHRNSCSVCYNTLKESLLYKDSNVQELSKTFFPPRKNIPEFVEITYHFGENTNDTQVWFWTKESSYLFFPMETFQFLSLFFGKPAQFFTQSMTLHLDEECSDVDYDMLRLLTQRLKNFIEKAKINPEIDDNYFARSQENIESLEDDIISQHTTKYILAFQIIGFFLSVAIAVMILIITYNSKRWDTKLTNLSKLSNANRSSQAKIFSITLTMSIINLYIITLDICTLVYAKESDVKKAKELSILPIIVVVIDILCILCCILFGLRFMTKFISERKLYYTSLALSTLGPTLSVVVHLPYILIAYLNDASYASSMFIFYTVIVFILFGALDVSFNTCIGALNHREKNTLQANVERGGAADNQPDTPPAENPQHNQPVAHLYPMYNYDKRGIMCCSVLFLLLFIILLLILMGMITAALVVIPISRALSDAPNRLFGFYQVVIVLIGAYFVYKKFFKNKPTLESVVEDIEDNILDSEGQSWEGLSTNEKLINFYTHIMTIIGKIDPKNNNIIKKRERQPTEGQQQRTEEHEQGQQLTEELEHRQQQLREELRQGQQELREELVQGQQQLIQELGHGRQQIIGELGQGQQQALQVQQDLLETLKQLLEVQKSHASNRRASV